MKCIAIAAATAAVLSATPASAATFLVTGSGGGEALTFCAGGVLCRTNILFDFSYVAEEAAPEWHLGKLTASAFDLSFRRNESTISQNVLVGASHNGTTGTGTFMVSEYGRGLASIEAGRGTLALTVEGYVGNRRINDLQFSVRAVPEPATWAMMIGGFALVGGAVRRRGHTVVVA